MASSDFPQALAAAQDGDEAAFTMLFRSVQPGLLRYLRMLAGSAADDVAAETWAAVVRDLGTFGGSEVAFRSWVYTVARHRFLDMRRSRARRPETVVAEPPEPDCVADAATAVEEMFSTERALALVSSLPRAQAEVVMLRVVAGLDVTSTAIIVGKTSSHVRVLCHRGLRRLAVVLGERSRADL